MPATATPSWNDASTTPLALQVLARGAVVSATIDLRTKFGAYALVMVSRMGTTALSNGVDVIFRRTLANAARRHLGGFPALRSNVTAAVETTWKQGKPSSSNRIKCLIT